MWPQPCTLKCHAIAARIFTRLRSLQAAISAVLFEALGDGQATMAPEDTPAVDAEVRRAERCAARRCVGPPALFPCGRLQWGGQQQQQEEAAEEEPGTQQASQQTRRRRRSRRGGGHRGRTPGLATPRLPSGVCVCGRGDAACGCLAVGPLLRAFVSKRRSPPPTPAAAALPLLLPPLPSHPGGPAAPAPASPPLTPRRSCCPCPCRFAAPSVVELLLNNNRLAGLQGLSADGFRQAH